MNAGGHCNKITTIGKIMPDLQTPRQIVQLVAQSTDDMIEKIKVWLKLNGYGIHELSEWETPKSFCKRVKISPSTLHRKMQGRRCPKVEVDRGPSGRLIRFRPTSELEKYCNAKETATTLLQGEARDEELSS
jgi:hypothetical protein